MPYRMNMTSIQLHVKWALLKGDIDIIIIIIIIIVVIFIIW
jgi:hypothetical protein